MHKVSIVIPMYNESRYIARCLDSLKNQSYKDFEIILIDDGSKDNTIKIAEGYKKNFKLTILKQQHGGPGSARNRGAKEAKGDIFVFVDADMMFDIHYIEFLIEPITQGDEIGTAHGREYVANKENKIARAFSLIRASYNAKNTRGGVFRAIRKDVFLSAGGFDTSKGYTDDDLSQRVGSSLILDGPIAYHNNPESFGEIYKHSIRVGKSLRSSGDIVYYLKKYALWGILFMICVISVFVHIGFEQGFIYSLLILLIFIILKGAHRARTERYRTHLIYVPVVMITRGLGYVHGMVSNMLFRKIY